MSNKNYNQARIYKITCNLPSINEIYIGSTAEYEKRCVAHRSDCHNVNSPNYSYKVYNYIRNNGGFGNFTIDVIEHYPCANKTAMRIREQYWINEYKPTLNTNRAYRTEEDSITDMKQYYQVNKAELKEQMKQCNEKEKHKQYRKQVIQCLNCGKFHTKRDTTNHRRTKYCKNYKPTTSESSTESIINSDTDVE